MRIEEVTCWCQQNLNKYCTRRKIWRIQKCHRKWTISDRFPCLERSWIGFVLPYITHKCCSVCSSSWDSLSFDRFPCHHFRSDSRSARIQIWVFLSRKTRKFLYLNMTVLLPSEQSWELRPLRTLSVSSLWALLQSKKSSSSSCLCFCKQKVNSQINIHLMSAYRISDPNVVIS